MTDLENALTTLVYDIKQLAKLESDRLDLLNTPLSMAMKDEREEDLKREIERRHSRVRRVLQQLLDFPPQHIRHEQALEQFYSTAPFDKSVFVMTKFPSPDLSQPVDRELAAVIKAVRDAVEKCGYTARVASDQRFHPQLWDNVELYLLGCRRGIAIVEDKYLPELNPNVAMEWGWMRGMGRDVLYLVEKDFTKQRADWGGLIESPFDWSNPGPGIETAVKDWLRGKPESP